MVALKSCGNCSLCVLDEVAQKYVCGPEKYLVTSVVNGDVAGALGVLYRSGNECPSWIAGEKKVKPVVAVAASVVGGGVVYGAKAAVGWVVASVLGGGFLGTWLLILWGVI